MFVNGVRLGRSGEMRGASRRHIDRQWKTLLPWARLLQVLLSLGLLVALVVSAPRLMNWLNQSIARVEVHGGFENLSQKQVKSVLQPMLKGRFFSLELNAIRQTLLAMPWVKNAAVRRQWPDKIQVTLQERQPVARWGEQHLISNEGVIFAPQSLSGFTTLPILAGRETSAQEVMQQYLAISQLLRPIGLRLKTLTRSDSAAWLFTVGHVQVNIGRHRRMERLQRFVRLYHGVLKARWQTVERVDLRYLNGASVAWRQAYVQSGSASSGL